MQAQFNLGVVYTQEERFSEAAPAFQEAMRLDPSDDVTRLTYVKTLVAWSILMRRHLSFAIDCAAGLTISMRST